MFANRYYPPTYFADRYWGTTAEPVVAVPDGCIHVPGIGVHFIDGLSVGMWLMSGAEWATFSIRSTAESCEQLAPVAVDHVTFGTVGVICD